MREFRTDSFPLSSRNAAIAIVLLALEGDRGNEPDSYLYSSSNVESIRRTIAKRIFNCEPNDASILRRKEINDFCDYISNIGIDRFKEIILQSFMYYLDVDRSTFDDDIKTKLKGSII